MAFLNRIILRNPLALLKQNNKPSLSCLHFHTGKITLKQDKNENLIIPTEMKEENKLNFMEKYGLDDWKITLPIGALITIPVLSNGVYVINEETQLAVCFLLFCTSVYKYGGGMIGSYFEEKAQNMLREHNELEDQNIQIAEKLLENYENRLNIFDDLTSIINFRKALSKEMAKLRTNKIRHEVRDTIVQNLESLIPLENNLKSTIHQKIVQYAYDQVKQVVSKGDRSLKDNAFKDALTSLGSSNGKNNTSQKEDPIVTLFNKYINEYKNNIEKRVGQEIVLSDDELRQVQNDVITFAKKNDVEITDIKFDKKSKFQLVL